MNEKNLPAPPRSSWEAKKVKLKVMFPQLIDADLHFDETKRAEMLNELQVKVGKTVSELQVVLESL